MKQRFYSLFFMLTCGLLAAAGLQGQTPVAYYPFSGNAKDSGPYANHASVNGTQLTQDRFDWSNTAMIFDGVQGAVKAENIPQFNTPLATVAFWVKVNQLPDQGEAFLISLGGWQERFKISLPPHGKVVWTTNHSNGISDMDAGDGNELQEGVWMHVAAVHDGTNDKIYINGALAATKAVAGTLNSTTYPLGIGYNPIDNANYFDGSIDEVVLLDIALNDFQIAALYAFQSAPPAVDPGRVAAYSFSGNGADQSDFSNHADVSTARMTTDRFGYGKSALLCDGTSSEVSAANSAHMNSPYTTVSFWVKPNSLPGTGEAFLLSFGGWQERWKISLPPHGKPVWTTNHTNGISDMDSGGGNELQPNVWTHVVMVHDGLKDRIYMDGVQVAEKDVVGDLNETTKPFGIGYNPIDGGNWFDGVLDEVEMYNYALSATEIADLYTAQSTFPGTTDNLVAHYSLDGNGEDGTQFGNHAELEDGATAVSNRHDWGSNALEGAVTADNSIALQSDYTTISFWVKPNAFPPFGEAYLLSNGGWQERWKISLPDHGKPVFTTHSGGACCSDMDSGTPLALDTWTHVAMVHDGTNDKIYLNGALANTKAVSGALDKTKYPLGIGYDPIDNGSFFDGAIDDVLIFNEALDDAAIADLYDLQSTAPTMPGDLVAYYSFSGNGLDETAYNNHSSGSQLGIDRFGKANKSAVFNGTSTEVTAANSPQLNTPQTTVSFWANPNSLPGTGEAFLLSFGGWQERWKISLPPHGKPVWTTNHANGISDMDSGDGNELVVGTWTHVVMVHDGLKDKIYMDGALVAEKDVVGDLDNTVHPFGIGYNPIDGGNWFDGYIDEVQIYKVALSDSEIADLYDQQSQPPMSSDTEAPDAPLNLTASVSFNNVTLNWFPATDNVGVVAYNVYLEGVLAMTTGNTNAYFPDLTPLTDFVFGVTAVDAEGNESLMTTRTVTTGPDETPDTTPPTVPGNLSGQPSFNSVLLTWEASTDDTQVAGYVILVDGEIADTVGGTVTSNFVGGLEPSTLYTFEVYAFDLAGNNSGLAELTLSTTEPLVTDEPGLVAHYPFDGDANDATPYNNHGVIGGDPIFETATHPFGGQNIKFDGQQDSVLAPNAVQLISDFTTVSFWIRVDDINTQDAEAYVMDFGHWDQRWKISLPQHLKIVWTTNSNNTQFPVFISDMDSGDGNEMVIGFWWYVTMVHDGTNDIIYVNGIPANTKPVDGKLNATTRPLGFGNNPVDGGQYFIGALDNVKIYNRAVTADEALRLFETGVVSTEELSNLLTPYIQEVFPNPTTDLLTVNHSLPSNQPLLVRVFDLQGRQVDQLHFDKGEVANGQITLNVSGYPQGLYTLNFVLGGKNLGALKFQKQ
jgi:hypothetical protein